MNSLSTGSPTQHLLDACVPNYVGTRTYARKIKKHGNTWAAVGAYHSETPTLRDAYARRIHDIVDGQNSGASR